MTRARSTTCDLVLGDGTTITLTPTSTSGGLTKFAPARMASGDVVSGVRIAIPLERESFPAGGTYAVVLPNPLDFTL